MDWRIGVDLSDVLVEGEDIIGVNIAARLEGIAEPDGICISELVEKSRVPAVYCVCEFVEASGLMAYEADFGEAARRMADDVHQILDGANPADIPIYQSIRFALVTDLKSATLCPNLPPALLGRADEVIE
jgi:putative tryptophan/tyrosine transport system substrate-binding protein